MAFNLTPPLFVKAETAVALLQPNDRDEPEPLCISMAKWSALRLFRHWAREIELLLEGLRDKCCIVSGLTVLEGATVPSEWWIAYSQEGSVRLRYQVLRVESVDGWGDPNQWWEHVCPYDVSSHGESPPSEWNVSREELAAWLSHCSVLIAAAETVVADEEE